jgi:hypothetical protein
MALVPWLYPTTLMMSFVQFPPRKGCLLAAQRTLAPKGPADGGKLRLVDPPPDPPSPPLADEQASFGQDPGVVRNSRLALGERALQLARTDLLPRSDDREQAQADRVGERCKHTGQLGRLSFAQRPSNYRRAAEAPLLHIDHRLCPCHGPSRKHIDSLRCTC